MPTDQRSLSRRCLLQTAGGIAAATALGPFAIRSARGQAATTLRFASLFNEAHASSQSSKRFAELVEEKTGSAVKVQVFYNAVLGDEAQVGEGVRTGTIDMGFAGQVGFGSYIRDIRVLELPYLYRDFDELHRVYSEIRPTLDQRFSENGVQLLGQVYEGPRMTLATRPLESYDDFAGLKLRVPQSPVYIAMAEAFGAVPTPVAFPEVYTALQAGVVEALEGSPSTLYTGKFYEVADNLARTDHIFTAVYFGISPQTFEALAPGVQDAILAAADEATLYNLDLVKQGFVTDLGRLKEAGVSETMPDLAPFRDAVAVANLAFAEDLGGTSLELYEQVKALSKG
jgi:tripartite ATP-independent transporter DctP family solute receptor